MPEDTKRPRLEDEAEKSLSLDGVARRIEKLSLAVAQQTERLLAKSERADEDLETILDAARRSSDLARELVVLARRERDAAAATLLSVTNSQPPRSDRPTDSAPPVFSQRRVRGDAGPPVVLLVDDEPLLLKTMLRMMEGYGLRVLSATSASEALALAAGHLEIDLLVADLLLPGMSGSELVKKLRASRPELRVLYMSGWDPAASGVNISNDRRAAFLSKPFSAAELDACLAELIGTPRQRFADRR